MHSCQHPEPLKRAFWFSRLLLSLATLSIKCRFAKEEHTEHRIEDLSTVDFALTFHLPSVCAIRRLLLRFSQPSCGFWATINQDALSERRTARWI